MNAASKPSHFVMPGLVPGIHAAMDCRVKPGTDEAGGVAALVER